jgi:hypothetical protein
VALYIPAGRRRRRLVLAAVGAAVAGLVLGWALGRSTAPTVADRVDSVRTEARSLDARLAALPNEYDKVLAGDPQYANGGGPADSLTVIVADTGDLAGRTPWLTDGQRTAVVDAVAAAQRAAAAAAPASEFADAVAGATTTINQTFGLNGASS